MRRSWSGPTDGMTEPFYLTITRTAYDTVAADYATLLRDALAASPFDRVTLAAFAEQVGEGLPTVVR